MNACISFSCAIERRRKDLELQQLQAEKQEMLLTKDLELTRLMEENQLALIKLQESEKEKEDLVSITCLK
jgi:hypothetical protein